MSNKNAAQWDLLAGDKAVADSENLFHLDVKTKQL